jgi:hypothetical protein
MRKSCGGSWLGQGVLDAREPVTISVVGKCSHVVNILVAQFGILPARSLAPLAKAVGFRMTSFKTMPDSEHYDYE